MYALGSEMKTIFLHVGTHKTGTTSIQHFLARNRYELQERGFSYPDIHMLEDAHHCLGGQLINGVGLSIFSGGEEFPRDGKERSGRWKDLKQYLEHSDYENIIISGISDIIRYDFLLFLWFNKVH